MQQSFRPSVHCRHALWTLLAAALLSLPVRAATTMEPEQEDDAKILRYVLIVATNSAYDRTLSPLRYADDDGMLYSQFFDPFAQRVTLLTTLDDETQQRYAGAAAKTLAPTRATFERELRDIFAEIRGAKAAGAKRVDLVFVYVGHGAIDDEGKGYVYLGDARLTRAEVFSEIIAASPADNTHLIVDACHAYSLVAGRGEETDGPSAPTAFETFLQGHDLEQYPNVGVLLASSDERETHEWSRIRAGVFSHQVRSGLTGAADINHDGRIEYSEIAAFVEAANAGLGGVGKRIHTLAWAPTHDRSVELLRIRNASDMRYLYVAPEATGHFHLETTRAERWAEFHKPAGEILVLALPSSMDFYLRDATRERKIEAGTNVVEIAAPLTELYAVAERGAIDQAFEAGLFALPFATAYYQGFVGARRDFVPVAPSQGPTWLGYVRCEVIPEPPAATQPSVTARPARNEAGYVFARALLRPATRYSNGLLVRRSRPLSAYVDASFAVSAHFSRLRYMHETDLYAGSLLVGLTALRATPWGPEVFAGIEVGASALKLTHNGGADGTVPTAQLRLGLSGAIDARWGWSLAANAVAYAVTLDGETKTRTTPGLQAGIRW